MSLPVQDIEEALLTSQWKGESGPFESPVLVLAYKTVNGKLQDVLTSTPIQNLLRLNYSGAELLDHPIESWFSFNDTENLTDQERELLLLLLGVASLHAFIQVNWTGPDFTISSADVVLKANGIPLDSDSSSISENDLNQKAVSELSCGGEPAYHLSRLAIFLRISQLIFDQPSSKYRCIQSVKWWRLRTARVHQQVLDETVGVPEEVMDVEELYSGIAKERELAGLLSLEKGLLAHQIGQDKRASELFLEAARNTGLEYELTGALGKRTKFQENELSQLVLLAESRLQVENDNSTKTDHVTSNSESSKPNVVSITVSDSDKSDAIISTSSLPETLALNDDTLLEQTQFTSSSGGGSSSKLAHIDPSEQPALHPLDQCIFLSMCLNVKNMSPTHGLTQEQMKPYVARVISHPRNWSVHTMALLLRSRLEAERTRTVERSTLQLQALVDQMPSADSSLPERLKYIHAIPMPSKWELEVELAKRFLALGVVRSALEIFERLEMWEDVVQCWQVLERPASGIAIVKDLLEGRKEESENVLLRGKASSERRKPALDSAREAKLWCLLGELEPENAVKHFTRAWDASGQKSGRAMRSLGGYYFSREDYPKAIDCLQKAVAINPLQFRSWFILGCAFVREEKWEKARDAFSRCIAIDDEDSESWNNLASVYLRMGSPRNTEKANNSGDEQSSDESKNSDTGAIVPFENKYLAFRALKIGLKYSYENWRMWSNYMVVAMDVGEFAEAVRAQARVVEELAPKAGAKAVDPDLLDRLVSVVTRGSTVDGTGNSDGIMSVSARSPIEAENLRLRITELFERTILPKVSSQRIYNAYARLLVFQERWSEAVKYYLDAYRFTPAATMDKNSEIDRKAWLEAVNEVEEIVDVLRNFGPRAEEEQQQSSTSGEGELEKTRSGRWQLQARSIVRTFMARTRDAFEDDSEWEKLSELLEELKEARR